MSRHCNKSIIIKALLSSFVFLAQAILSLLELDNAFFDSLIALIIFYLLLTSNSKNAGWLGFFVGIMSFYWMSFSLYHLNLWYLTPLALLIIGITYGLIFWLLDFVSSFAQRYAVFAKALLSVFYFDYATPFGFNWFKPETFLADGFFGTSKLQLFIVLFSIALFAVLRNRKRYLPLVLLLFALETTPQKSTCNLKIYLANTHVKFEDKYELINIINNFSIIDTAIEQKYDLVVLPETSFPFALNQAPEIIDKLLEKSTQIAILCGSVRVDGKNVYNTNYLFADGKMQTFDKVIGVPFGEVNPMPEFMSDFVNEIFFGGADDFKTAKDFSDFSIHGTTFRNAVCYEATKDELYYDKPKYVMALSNNSWFIPSLEPILQKKLLKYYSKHYGTTIYHCVNMSPSYVIQ